MIWCFVVLFLVGDIWCYNKASDVLVLRNKKLRFIPGSEFYLYLKGKSLI